MLQAIKSTNVKVIALLHAATVQHMLRSPLALFEVLRF